MPPPFSNKLIPGFGNGLTTMPKRFLWQSKAGKISGVDDAFPKFALPVILSQLYFLGGFRRKRAWIFCWELFLFFSVIFLLFGLASFSLRFPLVFFHFSYLSFVFHRFSLVFLVFPRVFLNFPNVSFVFHRFSLVFLVFPLFCLHFPYFAFVFHPVFVGCPCFSIGFEPFSLRFHWFYYMFIISLCLLL